MFLPVVLYGCENCSLTIREEHRLRVSENRVLRRIFRPKKKEAAGGWRTLHDEEFHNLYASPDIFQVIKSRRGEECGTHGGMRDAYKIWAGKPEKKRPLGRLCNKWEDNIRMNLREIWWKLWTGFIWLSIAGCCENGNEPSGSIKVGKFLD
jgi:hypothetical protein